MAQHQANLAELYLLKTQLIEFGEEGSDLYLAVLNAIDTGQLLVDEALYRQEWDHLSAANSYQ